MARPMPPPPPVTSARRPARSGPGSWGVVMSSSRLAACLGQNDNVFQRPGAGGGRMYIGYDEEQEGLRRELREYYAKLLTPQVEAALSHSRGVGATPRAIWKQMCQDGWAGVGWPKEYGGQGRPAVEQFCFFGESMRAGAPGPILSLNNLGPTLIKLGTD